ncbi:Lactate dehydrogenase [Polaromonas sp. OV174]|uniref:hypothetical protein n=1 Tax=Polaromonas sp. OV174 TaxID=1855300 RepID=UPI0008E87C45|nr:hypothetical protein [Polaromonas sp. OV174]SFC73828.1 Lactate dehydrogenase [Polaromonas sp. OV174]
MLDRSLRHRVLVTRPIAEDAMRRLDTFFEVETRLDDRVPDADELVRWLAGKAGVIADSRFVFDAPVVQQLPMLKAICNLDAAHDNLDLSLLTRAGIRATNTPERGSAAQALEAASEQAWLILHRLLQQRVPEAQAQGRYSAQWSRRVTLAAPLKTLAVAFTVDDALSQALALSAAAERANVLMPQGSSGGSSSAVTRLDRAALWRDADVVVLGGDLAAAPVSMADMAMLKPSAVVLNLAGVNALAPEVWDDAGLRARIEGGAARPDGGGVQAAPDLQSAARVTAENLIAALGFGRNGWHPAHLLNPDILCDSCC